MQEIKITEMLGNIAVILLNIEIIEINARIIFFNLRFTVSNEIPVVFHNSSNYDYHFIIKKLARNLKESLNVIEIIRKSVKILLFQ